MLKNFSLLIPDARDPYYMARLAHSAIRTAAYPGQVQVVFCIEKNNSRASAESHALYSKYPVSLFDPTPVATIKHLTNSGKMLGQTVEEDILLKLAGKADAARSIVLSQEYEFVHKHWDKQLLDLIDAAPHSRSWRSGELTVHADILDHLKTLVS